MSEPTTNREVVKLYREALMKQMGDKYDENVFKKALGRCKTWCKNAYGKADLVEHYNESGSLDYYYAEVLEGSFLTFNRDNEYSHRRDVKRSRK